MCTLQHEMHDIYVQTCPKMTEPCTISSLFFLPSAKILSALASEIPLIAKRAFFGVKAIDSTVW